MTVQSIRSELESIMTKSIDLALTNKDDECFYVDALNLRQDIIFLETKIFAFSQDHDLTEKEIEALSIYKNKLNLMIAECESKTANIN